MGFFLLCSHSEVVLRYTGLWVTILFCNWSISITSCNDFFHFSFNIVVQLIIFPGKGLICVFPFLLRVVLQFFYLLGGHPFDFATNALNILSCLLSHHGYLSNSFAIFLRSCIVFNHNKWKYSCVELRA